MGGEEDFSLTECSVPPQALQTHTAKYSELEQRHTEWTSKCEESYKKSDHVKKLNTELLRRCEDISRAYVQERKEGIKCKTL